jgi:drug/metabolite transporter (DMT)-like permease
MSVQMSSVPPTKAASLYRFGIIIVAVSSTVNSVGALFVRHVEHASEWQIIMLRASSLSVSLLIVFALQKRGRILRGFWDAGRWALLGAIFVAIANIGIIHALQNTTVANTLFILSAAPLLTAVLARVFLGELVSITTWLAMSVAVAGIALMVGESFGTRTVFGNAMALLTVCAFSCFMVVLRRGRNANMLPAAILGAALSATISIVASGFDFAITGHDLTLCVVWGAGISCVVHAMFTVGSRYVPGAELALLVLLEFVMGPVWVWLFVDEVPTQMTIVGGAIVFSAVAGRALLLARR